jgi:isopenicillin N synthase-like dioxygenase
MQILTVNYTDKNAAETFCQSLKETGFAVLTHHPIAPALIETTYDQWRDFFNSDKKQQYLFDRETQDGYFPFKSENAKDSKVSDLKEFYHYYPWGKIPESLKQHTVSMYESLGTLAATLLQWIEQQLPADVSGRLSMPLQAMLQNSKSTLLRILHYPPLDAHMEKGAVRAAAHEDINLITLLPAATAPGLEVLDTKGQWHAVACDPGSIVVNVGDMLQMCTEHYFKSTTHRVVNPADQTNNSSRYSMPLFLHAESSVRISEQYTASEYLRERLRQIGIY